MADDIDVNETLEAALPEAAAEVAEAAAEEVVEAAPVETAEGGAEAAAEEEPAEVTPGEDAVAAASSDDDAAADGDKRRRPAGARRTPVALEEKVKRGEVAAERLLSLLGVQAEGIAGRVEGEQVVLQVEKIEGPVELDNRAYEALQFMLNKAINRGAARRTRLALQTDGFRGRRADGLGRVAAHLSHKARKLGVTLSIGPLGANDLRALTVQLNRQKGLQLESTGEGELRRLVVSAADAHDAGDETEGGGRRRRRRRKRRRA